ncbi:hypothetical protein BX616_003531 [Lobosporangium transversale]|nr:hypothetical protein BX616_003531 [Lobosporangium transversale]
MLTSIQSALCCWTAQQTPPASPAWPCSSGHSAATCTCSVIDNSYSSEKAQDVESSQEKTVLGRDSVNSADSDININTNTNTNDPVLQPPSPVVLPNSHSPSSSPSHQQQHQPRRPSSNGSISSITSSRSNPVRGFLSNPSSSYNNDDQQQTHQIQSSASTSSKTFSLQKYYYPRNSMTPIASPDSSSPTKSTSFSKMNTTSSGPLSPLAFEGPRSLGLKSPPASITSLPSPTPQGTSTPQPPLLSLTIPPEVEPSPPAPTETTEISLVSLSTVNPFYSPVSPAPLLTPSPSLILPSKPAETSPKSSPTLTTNVALPLSSSSLPSFSLSPPSSPPPSVSTSSSPSTSPSNSPVETSSKSLISSPPQSDATPYPASGISPAKLAALIERGQPNKQGVSAGPRPLVLDLRPNPDFDPISIVHSININLPTLLMRRYRRGGAMSSFALESFITMPSDKDLYHVILDGWRLDQDHNGNEATHDVVVLDQDMKDGQEEYGRSASQAWTLVSVLERGGGNCGGPIRLWYLEGGFEAFQTWDVSEKFLVRPGSTFEISVTHDGQNQQQEQGAMGEDDGSQPRMMPLSLPSNASSSTVTDAKTAQAIDHAVSLTNASLAGAPRQRGPAVRRESLFSLNTKSLQRPTNLARSQSVGVSALNLKPLSVAPPPLPTLPSGLMPLQEGSGMNNNANGLSRKGSWLTVPSGNSAPGPTLSPAMSMSSSTMEMMQQSASPDHSSTWSAGGSIHGDSAGASLQRMGSKRSFSSTSTLLSMGASGATLGIQEEDEEAGADDDKNDAHASPTSNGGLRRHHSSSSMQLSASTDSTCLDANGSNNSDQSPPVHSANMFADGIDSFNNNSSSLHSNNNMLAMMSQQQQQGYGYNDEMAEEGGDDGEQEISCILPNFLYLGPEIATEEQVLELERLGIKRVLNMARECEDLLVMNRPGMEYHKIGVLDHIEADVSAGLLQAVDIISASNDAPIYVHCKAGKSRSVTAIIAYLITQLHWSLNKAYNHVLTQRPCMCPNIGFVTELMRMEERTLGMERSGGLVRAGSLNSILSLSTAGSTPQHAHHYHHHSLQHHHSLNKTGSPKVLSNKSSMNSLAVISPPFQA